MYLSFFRTAKLFFSWEHEEQCGFHGVPWPPSLLTFPDVTGAGRFRHKSSRWGLGSLAHAEPYLCGTTQGLRTRNVINKAKCRECYKPPTFGSHALGMFYSNQLRREP